MIEFTINCYTTIKIDNTDDIKAMYISLGDDSKFLNSDVLFGEILQVYSCNYNGKVEMKTRIIQPHRHIRTLIHTMYTFSDERLPYWMVS